MNPPLKESKQIDASVEWLWFKPIRDRGGLLGIFIFTNRVKGLQCPQYNSSLVIDISLLNCLLKLTDINLFTGCVVCNGFYKLKSMTYVIYVYVLFSYIQHGREVVVNINIRFPFLCMFPNKTQIICQLYIERRGSEITGL